MSELESIKPSEYAVDRTDWGAGPWDTEPDYIQWQHAGYACLIVRNRMGALCGYVGVDEAHPSFGKGYDDVDVDVHGGLTYADKCTGHICHVPESGMPDSVWWLGFDTSHAFDLVPRMEAFERKYDLRRRGLAIFPPITNAAGEAAGISEAFTLPKDTYRDVAYTTKETNELAEQLRAMTEPNQIA